MHPTGSTSRALPDTLAAVDVGTNSVHMVVARVAGNDRFEVLTRHKEMVRLGSGEGEMKELAPDAMDRGVAALERCRRIADGQGAVVHAVATSAVREALNAQEFIRRVRDEAGIELNVISGVEEARLIQLGVLQALPVFDRPMVLIDVGGGSTEILYGLGTDVRYARSLKLGSLRMTRRFFPGGEVPAADADGDPVARARAFVASQLAAVAHEAASLGHDVAVASSGTAETLAAMALVRAGEEVPQSLNGVVLSRKALGKVVRDLAAARTPEERRKVPGIDASRADIILGGALILEGACDALGIEELTISTGALREGALLDALGRRGGSGLERLSDLRRQSVRHLMAACDDDPDHSLQVARLALQVFDLLADRLGGAPEDRELLEAAALLSNVGLFISHSAHHKHSYYVIRNSEHLSGFTDSETEVIALVARYHRKSAPSADKHAEFAALGEHDRDRVRRLAAVLRVAIAMDRNHEGDVQFVTLAEPGDADELVLVMHPDGTADLDLERFSAEERRSLLEEVLGVAVRIEVAPRRSAVA